MSAEQVSELLAAAASDPRLAAQFARATTLEQVVAVATELGFAVTAQDLQEAVTQTPRDQLSDAELEAAAGGGSPSLDPMLCPTGHCQSMYGLGCA